MVAASPQDKKEFRKMMISTILATDMTSHFASQSEFKNRIEAADFDPTGNDK